MIFSIAFLVLLTFGRYSLLQVRDCDDGWDESDCGDPEAVNQELTYRCTDVFYFLII